MGPVPGREALEAMKRTDIQKLCKDYGVKANLKTEALIDLLLDASRPQPSRSNPPQPPERSTSRISSHSGIRRGSLIIHGAGNDIIEEGTSSPVEEVKPPPPPSPRQLPRTRKAKESQYRLGVGRPVVAGGSGARSITKSVSVSRKSKRGKSSTSVKPSEATITEGNATAILCRYANKDDSGVTTNGGLQSEPVVSNELVQSAVAKALAPVQKELELQKTQLSELKDKVSGMIASFEIRIRDLTSEIRDLRAKAVGATADTRDAGPSARIPQPPSTPKRVWTPHRSYFAFGEKGGPSELLSDSSDRGAHAHSEAGSGLNVKPAQSGVLLPGFAQSTLGKRARDSTSEEDAELRGPAGSAETELEIRIGRSASKRAKSHTDDSEDVRTTQQRQSQPLSCIGEIDEVPELEPAIKSLPELSCGPSSPPPTNVPAASSDQSDSQNAFHFNFLPTTSTPTYAAFPLSMGMFPLPERPISPSPASNAERGQVEGFGSSTVPQASSRSSSGRGVSGDSQMYTEASGSGGVRRVPSSNETSATDPETPAPPAKRTMYGTELEADTRFGDFGVEGVASGFWAKSRF
ncbi:hypothetical protein F5J12DRAFT_835767 [Pisolithus orientalis]|uniref:uncharacterized protein n=1 Tax=Pisolithus orientalis TaxID=936130 RepID=UPI0022258B8B|nr:uncharacterized protein F5J12DRAFT_835767 [Pisolithus orientalis]KAI6005253.1 hypothetical protein F5J12DRAFT_835767 [Pisolithus orientalis]